MKLHGYWRSSTSYRVRIALNLKGCIYETVPVNLLTGEHRQPAYLGLNPSGTVPALDWDGRIYSQSMAIIELLEECISDPPLWPADVHARAAARELAFAIATETHAPGNMRALSWLRANFGASDDQVKAWIAETVATTFGPLEARLSALRWTAGLPFGAPTVFEVVLAPQMYNARRWGVDLSPYPLLVRIDATCSEMDAFARAAPERQPDAPEGAKPP